MHWPLEPRAPCSDSRPLRGGMGGGTSVQEYWHRGLHSLLSHRQRIRLYAGPSTALLSCPTNSAPETSSLLTDDTRRQPGDGVEEGLRIRGSDQQAADLRRASRPGHSYSCSRCHSCSHPSGYSNGHPHRQFTPVPLSPAQACTLRPWPSAPTRGGTPTPVGPGSPRRAPPTRVSSPGSSFKTHSQWKPFDSTAHPVP